MNLLMNYGKSSDIINSASLEPTKIEKAGVEVAYMRSRLAPKVNGSFPEKSWKQFIEYRKSFDSNQIANLIHPKEDIVEIEIKPSEIIGKGYAKV